MGGSIKLGIAVALVLGTVPTAHGTEGAHCASMLVPLEPVGGPTLATLEPIGCFASYDRALEAGTGTSIDVSSEVSPATLTTELAEELSTTSSVVIGTEYDGYNFSSASHSYFASATCSSSIVWSVANVGADWNDRFQSGKGFGGCDTNKKFQHEDFAGDVRTCTPNCGDYAMLANEVTSLRWRS